MNAIFFQRPSPFGGANRFPAGRRKRVKRFLLLLRRAALLPAIRGWPLRRSGQSTNKEKTSMQLRLWPDAITFWTTPWSQPFRAACLRFTPETQPVLGQPCPDRYAPNWLRPLCLQRWVGQAIAARLAADPDTTAYRYKRESEPCWEPVAWVSYPRPILRSFADHTLLWIFSMEVERLLRIAQEDPRLAGVAYWTCAVLGASEHLAQLYRELKRRHKAMRAREMLREELRRFLAYDGQGEAASYLTLEIAGAPLLPEHANVLY
jgi:hypothetical protein